MKTSKRLFSILLALVMVLAMAVPALAAETGNITVTNAVPEQTYSVYRIFDLESYDEEAEAYIYEVNSSWNNFINQKESVSPDASKGIASISGTGGYVSVDDNGYVTWAKKNAQGQNEGMAEFAKLALAYAETNSITATATKTADEATEGQTTVELTFDNLGLGYYLLDSNVGTLCSLDTTNPDMPVTDKNEQPTVDKQVKEGQDWSDSNGAQIGDTVNFKVTITAQAGAQKYILHEKMDDGLTFTSNSVTVVKGTTTLASGTDYDVVSTSLTDGCTFHVEFTDTFCDKLAADDTITVTYSAVLNEKANIEQGEDNTVRLSYGEDSEITTLPKETTTYTYQFQIIKTNSEGGDNEKYDILTGAEFKLYTQRTGGTAIKFVKETDGAYRVATSTEISDSSVTTTEIIEAGTPIIKGLDSNESYWLEETKAPNGYNPMDGRQKVELTANNLAGEDAIDNDDNTFNASITGGVQVKNSKGNKLPTTGGIGTTIFYAAGGVLVVGAGFALVLMNRKSKKYAKK